jgi:hypothetical protein
MFLWNESRRLAQDRAAGACVQLAMGRYGERLSCAVGKDPTELDVTAALGVEWTVKPKRPRIATISAPERRRRLGIRRCQLHRDDDRGVRGESQGVQVFALEVQANGLLQVPGDLVQSRSLRDDGDLDTFGYISRLLTGTDDRLDGTLKLVHKFARRTQYSAVVPHGRRGLCDPAGSAGGLPRAVKATGGLPCHIRPNFRLVHCLVLVGLVRLGAPQIDAWRHYEHLAEADRVPAQGRRRVRVAELRAHIRDGLALRFACSDPLFQRHNPPETDGGAPGDPS